MRSPKVESVGVVATLLVRGPKFLAIFNPCWGAFAFPMSRRKQFVDPTVSHVATPEKLERAAARVAAEVLGRSFSSEGIPRPICKIKEFEQSDADGVWKLYHIRVFGLTLPAYATTVPGVIAEWLTREDFEIREPVTHTARYLLQELEANGKLPPWTK
jgi:hypothetical protein